MQHCTSRQSATDRSQRTVCRRRCNYLTVVVASRLLISQLLVSRSQ